LTSTRRLRQQQAPVFLSLSRQLFHLCVSAYYILLHRYYYIFYYYYTCVLILLVYVCPHATAEGSDQDTSQTQQVVETTQSTQLDMRCKSLETELDVSELSSSELYSTQPTQPTQLDLSDLYCTQPTQATLDMLQSRCACRLVVRHVCLCC
jgi:hypothetical protein